MNGDSLEIAQMISAVHTDLKNDFAGLKAEVAGMNGTFTAKIAGAEARIQDLEDENVRDEWKTWIGRFSFGGAILAIHKGMTLLGWKI